MQSVAPQVVQAIGAPESEPFNFQLPKKIGEIADRAQMLVVTPSFL